MHPFQWCNGERSFHVAGAVFCLQASVFKKKRGVKKKSTIRPVISWCVCVCVSVCECECECVSVCVCLCGEGVESDDGSSL